MSFILNIVIIKSAEDQNRFKYPYQDNCARAPSIHLSIYNFNIAQINIVRHLLGWDLDAIFLGSHKDQQNNP